MVATRQVEADDALASFVLGGPVIGARHVLLIAAGKRFGKRPREHFTQIAGEALHRQSVSAVALNPAAANTARPPVMAVFALVVALK